MSGKYIYIVICCIMLSAHSYQLKNTVCEGSLCLYLYESDNSRVTWDTSRTACTDKGLEMLRIESSQTQTVVNKLLQDLPQDRQREVWIGGRQSRDDTWRYLNGTEFHRTDNSASELNCVHVKLCKDANPEYVADNCDEKRSTSGVLCQYDKSETGECRQSDYQFGDKCYVKTPYDGSESNRTDWYSGQTYCSQSPIQGDIAYSYLDDNNYINSVRYLVDDNADGDSCALLWLGVRRRIWFWRTVSDSDGQPINYFNWLNGTLIQPSNDNCTYVDGDKGNKWRAQYCYNYLPYFICMNKNTTATTTTTTLTTTTTKQATKTGNSTVESESQQERSATTKLTTVATNPNTANRTSESKDQHERSDTISAVSVISVSVVIILIVLGAVGLAVFFIRRKKKKQNPDKYVNERFHKSSANQTKCEDPEYAKVEENTNHYGVTGGSEKPKKIKHSVAPSGDLYALPRQKKNAEDIYTEEKDENRNDVKYRETPSGDLYAVPEKKINKSKDEQLDGIKETSDDNVYSLAKGINE